MASGKKSALLSSLADYGDDSEPDSDPESEETEGRVSGLVYSYGDDDLNRTEAEVKVSGDEDSRESLSVMDDSDERRDTDDVEIPEIERKDPNELVALFSEKVRNMSPDEIRIPPEPPGRCSSQLQDKINKLYERKLHGDFDTNSHIQKKKEFRNPSIYEKLIQFCSIDELGTNYPKDMFDPHGWSEDSYYEALAKAQKVEMDKLEKAKKERTKIEFVTGTKKGTNPSSTAASTTSNTATTTATEAQKRKSKWDSAIPVTLGQPALITTTATLPAVVSVTTTASGTKTTVISAVGTILKKAKQ
ncbi:SAP30-binding protein isoform X2 [Anoplopoma fimbria]|uniref:SAP30-binding protein isoform X2 n=1 Tax=Anoplopoma fimbria TaxID=229290 RepID=UPI0023EBAA83|nr:SAP30-binding protein isoform X2 [Anoplopoma fimbria]